MMIRMTMAARIPTLLLLLMACLSYPCTSSFMAPIPPRARTNAYSGLAVSTTAMASAKASVEEDFVADFSSLPSMESLSPVQTLDSSRAMLSAIETARENQLVVVFFMPIIASCVNGVTSSTERWLIVIMKYASLD